jgi:hypothetical protein
MTGVEEEEAYNNRSLLERENFSLSSFLLCIVSAKVEIAFYFILAAEKFHLASLKIQWFAVY